MGVVEDLAKRTRELGPECDSAPAGDCSSEPTMSADSARADKPARRRHDVESALTYVTALICLVHAGMQLWHGNYMDCGHRAVTAQSIPSVIDESVTEFLRRCPPEPRPRPRKAMCTCDICRNRCF